MLRTLRSAWTSHSRKLQRRRFRVVSPVVSADVGVLADRVPFAGSRHQANPVVPAG